MSNFWTNLPRPFLVLAPMDDVTDVVFREMVCRTARPDVFFTEFANCEALQSEGRISQIHRLKFTNNQRPIVAQIWGIKPENFYNTAKLVRELGFDGVDVNMGCPDRAVMAQGACAGLIENPRLAGKIITATKQGAGDLPVSVKTRIGVRTIQTEEWIGFLLSCGLAAITVHGRTAAELSKVPAHWDEIGTAVKLRDQAGSKTMVIGNGDVKNYPEAVRKSLQYGVDGVMIGRGIFEDLLAFDKSSQPTPLSPEEKLQFLLEHVELFENTWGRAKNFAIMKKFFKIYTAGFIGAKELRIQLMAAKSARDTAAIVEKYLREFRQDQTPGKRNIHSGLPRDGQ